MNAPTDEQLLRDYLSGHQASFELLVRRHTQELFQFVQRFTGNSVAAEDIVQETFLQVHTSGSSFDPARRFKPWLFTIAANKARDFLRRRDRKREVGFDADINEGEEDHRRFIQLFSDESSAPDEDLERDEHRRLVKTVIEGMPTKLSEILILAYYHRFSYRHISEITGIPLGTVKSRLHAAIASFAEGYKSAVEDHADRSDT